MYQLLKVGTDTEVFLTHNGQPHPVIGLLGGTKLQPRPIISEGFAVQEDNVMPEFNIPASSTAVEFSSNIGKVLSWLNKDMGKRGFEVAIAPSMLFTPAQLDHPQAQEVGCEPDYCVWTRTVNESPKDNPQMTTLRTAGGHVHVSFKVHGKDPEKIYDKEPVVKALDVLLGLPSLILDKDTRRRSLYGKGGAFRPKDYGIEYRVLSNFWITNANYRKWVFNGVVQALDWINGESDSLNFTRFVNEYHEMIPKFINQQDTVGAKELLRQAGFSHRLDIQNLKG